MISIWEFNIPKYVLVVLLLAHFSKNSDAQCTDYVPVTLTYGTQNIGCTTVGVSFSGAANPWGGYCAIGPYLIGNMSTSGSVSFTFSPPVQEIKVDIESLDNHPNTNPMHYEEVRFDINGAYFPLAGPGSGATICRPQATVSSSGGLIAEPGTNSQNGYGETRDLVFPQTISSFKITDSIFFGAPHGVFASVYVCCTCNTDAGNITSDPVNVCIPNQISLPAATQTFLYSDDLLKYILFSNPANPTGSILAVSNTPEFSFNPATMQPGQPYYVASVAGHGVSGSIDYTDPCLDLSNQIEVEWNAQPTVTFSIGNANVCAGACATVTANFTGAPPFTLTYSSSFTGTATEVFSGNSGTFSICPPANAPGGPLLVSASNLVDAHCTCQ